MVSREANIPPTSAKTPKTNLLDYSSSSLASLPSALPGSTSSCPSWPTRASSPSTPSSTCPGTRSAAVARSSPRASAAPPRLTAPTRRRWTSWSKMLLRCSLRGEFERIVYLVLMTFFLARSLARRLAHSLRNWGLRGFHGFYEYDGNTYVHRSHCLACGLRKLHYRYEQSLSRG